MRGPLFNLRAVALAGGFALVAVAMVATAIDFSRDEPALRPAVPLLVPQSDPLAQDLTRCEALGTAAEQAPWCEVIWAEIQRRLFIHAPADSGSRNAQTPNPAASKPEGR
jgi:conjugative transfer region protein TrbK